MTRYIECPKCKFVAMYKIAATTYHCKFCAVTMSSDLVAQPKRKKNKIWNKKVKGSK